MTRRLITENWYKFLKEYEEPMPSSYDNDPEEGLMTKMALEKLVSLKAQKAAIEKEIEELELQIGSGMHSVSQIKEDNDG